MTTNQLNDSLNEQYINPKIWGPHFWFMFRCISNNYPESPSIDDITYTKSFFYSLRYLLPCIICRESYIGHYNKHPIDNYLSNKTQLIEWTDIIYKETNDSIIKQKEIPKDIPNTEVPLIKPTEIKPAPRICNSCGKKAVPNENAFPQANETNSGPDKGAIGSLRKILATSDVQTKYILISFYNWIKYPHSIPDVGVATSILKGYIILKNSNPEGFYPNYFIINNKKLYIVEENPQLLTDPETSIFMYNKFKTLSI